MVEVEVVLHNMELVPQVIKLVLEVLVEAVRVEDLPYLAELNQMEPPARQTPVAAVAVDQIQGQVHLLGGMEVLVL
jgi:hypothetical protein